MEWMYNDSMYLYKNNRKASCLLLLLCCIDSLAKKRFSNEKSNKKRYTNYLHEKFIMTFEFEESIRVEEKNKIIPLEEIIYEYFRCNLVHEGNKLENLDYEIIIDYDNFRRKYLIDMVNLKLIFGADWLIELLSEIIKKEI